ncbi:CsbD family protein [Kineosporia babensis]|uniref:CsbD family protein n=1 Tax=Kineosporia babensis TaxID=499548 RepID=A0A9X1NET7_9ACTN|nr:CsbD family protein [Kineosporia babensis]MCD5312539.1 CsbD family protein [Kineosporia babensis]
MSATDKIKNTAQNVAGKAKEAVGKVTDNERLENEGRADQASADVKQAGENVKDAFKR